MLCKTVKAGKISLPSYVHQTPKSRQDCYSVANVLTYAVIDIFSSQDMQFKNNHTQAHITGIYLPTTW